MIWIVIVDLKRCRGSERRKCDDLMGLILKGKSRMMGFVGLLQWERKQEGERWFRMERPRGGCLNEQSISIQIDQYRYKE